MTLYEHNHIDLFRALKYCIFPTYMPLFYFCLQRNASECLKWIVLLYHCLINIQYFSTLTKYPQQYGHITTVFFFYLHIKVSLTRCLNYL